MKTCFACKHEKSESDFWKDKSKPNGLQPLCKSCSNEKRLNWAKQKKVESEGTRVCSLCQSKKKLTEFAISRAQRQGRSLKCKECENIQNTARYHSSISTTDGQMRKMLNESRKRAKQKGLEHTITLNDITTIWTDTCPIFGVPLVRGNHLTAPSLDRIDPSKGYVMGNIIIISNKANIIKQNASPEEILAVGFFFKTLAS